MCWLVEFLGKEAQPVFTLELQVKVSQFNE